MAYDTLVDAINGLKAKGYTYDFNLKENRLNCTAAGRQLSPQEFEVTEVYRFEGMTSPDDSSILYAIESNDGIRGTLVSAYGVYADAVSNEMMAKLEIKH
jgi:hypothetical protein